MVIGLYRLIVGLLRCVSFIIYRRKVHGDQQLPKDIPIIVCSNHASMVDPVFLALSVDRPLHFMAKKELFTIKILGPIFRKLGAFPVDRGGVDITSFKQALRILKENKVLGIFPEGTREQEGRRQNFKDGVATIAVRTNAIIIPVRIDASYKLFSKVDVYIRDAIDPKDFPDGLTKEQLSKEIMDQVFHAIYPEVQQ